jgi:uncharacterized protein YkwD
VALAIAAGSAEARSHLTPLERRVVRLVNAVRIDHGLRRLYFSRRLSRAARTHSADMSRRGFFSHVSSDGTPMHMRVRSFYPARTVGEALAAIRGRRGAASTAVRLWMASPPHRAILLGTSFRRMGVGGMHGAWGGAPAWLVTADFAAR